LAGLNKTGNERMKHPIPHIILLIALSVNCIICYSQSAWVKVSANRDKILIGEPIELKLEALVPADAPVKWFPLDSLPHFEFIDKGKIDTMATGNGIQYRQTLTITSFDSGRWNIVALPLEVGNKNYLTDSLPVSVAFSNFDPSKDYHDIKDILEPAPAHLEYINWVIAGIAFFAVLLLIYFLRKKLPARQLPEIKKPAPTLSPLEEAMFALNRLDKKNLADPVSLKMFHTQLNDILRVFVYRKTGTATMEKTSSELMIQLKGTSLPNELFILLAQVMRMNDAVKFAKYLPTADENEQAFSTIKQSIELLDKKI
jgi:hypothetical protein